MYSNTYSYFLIFLWSISNKHYCCETKIQYSILPIITSRIYEVVFFSFLNVWQNITSCRALTSRLLLCLNNDQTLYFGGCEGKKQLNILLREIKEGRRELDLLSEGNVVSLLTSESFTYLNFMDEFPLPFRWMWTKIPHAERRGDRLCWGRKIQGLRKSDHMNLMQFVRTESELQTNLISADIWP